VPVGLQQPRGGKIAAGGEKPVGILERALDRRKRFRAFEPR